MEHESYVDVALPVMEAMVGHGDVTQVLYNSLEAFERCLNAPITQFIYITVRPNHDRGYELVPLLEKLKRELKTIHGCLAACWGPSMENDSVQVGVVGWRSIQVRFDLCAVASLSRIPSRIIYGWVSDIGAPGWSIAFY